MPDIHLCFPVWNYAHHADPYMASIRRIRESCVNDPDAEAVLIGSVFRIARAAKWPLEPLCQASGIPLDEVDNLPECLHA